MMNEEQIKAVKHIMESAEDMNEDYLEGVLNTLNLILEC